jgi:SAM-dependent methyltransferase
MKCFSVPSTFVTVKDGHVVAISESDQPQARVIANSSWLTILEIFLHEHTLEPAYQRFQSLHGVPMATPVRQLCTAVTSEADSVLVRIAETSLQVLHRGAELDCSALSKEHAQVLGALFSRATLAQDTHGIRSREAFSHTVDLLATLGLLAPLSHTLDWGDLRRRAPLCSVFGFSRGTPIDRYYLYQFLGKVRSQVRGTVLEVGGVLANRGRYQFDQAMDFQTLDLTAKPGVTHVGNVHDATLWPPASFDAIVILNVLEHCQQPWVVVNNIHRWLRRGGRCVCMVPGAQRVHNFPRDYWRLLPDGLQQLFEAFSQQQFYVYGNPLTVVANYLGIAAEELTLHELNERHPAYPVAICLVATK